MGGLSNKPTVLDEGRGMVKWSRAHLAMEGGGQIIYGLLGKMRRTVK